MLTQHYEYRFRTVRIVALENLPVRVIDCRKWAIFADNVRSCYSGAVRGTGKRPFTFTFPFRGFLVALARLKLPRC